MKSLHRMVVTGAFGGLAAATAVASGAFACTPSAQVLVDDRGGRLTDKPVLSHDWEFDVHVKHFWEPGETVEVAGEGAKRVGREIHVTWERNGQVVPENVGRDRSSFIVQNVWLPSGTTANETLVLAATQYFQDGTVARRMTAQVHVKPAPPPPPGTTGNVVTTPDGGGAVTSPQVPAAAPQPGPAPAARTLPAAPGAPQAGAVAERTPGASSAPAGPSSAAVEPEVPAASGSVVVDPETRLPVAPADLWSGVSGDGTSSLFDSSAAPRPESGTAPAGAVLLGFGVLALAGTAAVAGRRQLAVRRASR